jgi:hypothetical protein
MLAQRTRLTRADGHRAHGATGTGHMGRAVTAHAGRRAQGTWADGHGSKRPTDDDFEARPRPAARHGPTRSSTPGPRRAARHRPPTAARHRPTDGGSSGSAGAGSTRPYARSCGLHGPARRRPTHGGLTRTRGGRLDIGRAGWLDTDATGGGGPSVQPEACRSGWFPGFRSSGFARPWAAAVRLGESRRVHLTQLYHDGAGFPDPQIAHGKFCRSRLG